jgi:orotidine-5'-phosphate decarboxylase
MHVARAVNTWSSESLGACGMGAVGAVVGATYPEELALLRQAMPNVWFLVPGLGAQGGAAGDTAPAFRADGLGAIVNSARAIIFSYAPQESHWEAAVQRATEATIHALAEATPMKRLALGGRKGTCR